MRILVTASLKLIYPCILKNTVTLYHVFFTSFTAVQISDLADVLKVHVCMHVTLSLVLYSSPSTGTLRTHNVASTQLA